MLIELQQLVDFGMAVLQKRGLSGEDAQYIARAAVETEAFRRGTHGLEMLVNVYRRAAEFAGVAAEPKVVRETKCIAMADGQQSLGPIAARFACRLAAKKAAATGIGFVTVLKTEWLAALSTWLIPLARDGYIAYMWAQSSKGKAVAPFGGRQSRLSTNPIGMAIPSRPDPVVADFSTSTMSNGAMRQMRLSGEISGQPRFLDSEGNPSCDPAVVRDGGTMMLMGCLTDGHKGFAMALFNEALTLMAGGAAGEESVHGQSFSVMVLDPEAFAGREHVERQMSELARQLKTSAPREGFQQVRLPGERGFAAMADAKANGLPLDEEKIAMLRTLSAESGAALPDILK